MSVRTSNTDETFSSLRVYRGISWQVLGAEAGYYRCLEQSSGLGAGVAADYHLRGLAGSRRLRIYPIRYR